MVNSLNSVQAQFLAGQASDLTPKLMPQELQTKGVVDSLQIGKEGLSTEQAMGVVVERAMDRIRSVVDQAKAELGLAPDAELDTSPEATANRIADFAVGFFQAWRDQSDERLALPDEQARQQFADFIGGAINQGIGEARDILGALNALGDDVTAQIDSTGDLIQARLDDFVING
ncbi:MAG: hypothetical protein GY851_30960 [bacterium]|nr:hypothetical protein [bacterium]